MRTMILMGKFFSKSCQGKTFTNKLNCWSRHMHMHAWTFQFLIIYNKTINLYIYISGGLIYKVLQIKLLLEKYYYINTFKRVLTQIWVSVISNLQHIQQGFAWITTCVIFNLQHIQQAFACITTCVGINLHWLIH